MFPIIRRDVAVILIDNGAVFSDAIVYFHINATFVHLLEDVRIIAHYGLSHPDDFNHMSSG